MSRGDAGGFPPLCVSIPRLISMPCDQWRIPWPHPDIPGRDTGIFSSVIVIRSVDPELA
jgi:hypothetical protein